MVNLYYMENIKAIFCDFDWTLFDHKIRDFNKLGVKGLNIVHDKGIKLIINSARTYYSLKGLNTFNLIPFDGYVVANGGACIIDNKIIYALYIKDEIKNEIINFLNKNNYSYNLICLYDTFINDINKEIVNEFYQQFYEPYPIHISKYKDESCLSIQIFCREEDDEKLKVLANKYHLYFNRFSNCNVELTSHEFYKSKGVESIFNYLKLDKENAMAFGDDINDISMFDMVKYSVCLGNGNSKAKSHAFYVTDKIENNGLYNALKHFNLIKDKDI